jgi:BCD family chlorophyll transporter-like MFS transporter
MKLGGTIGALNARLGRKWGRIPSRFMPFADAATPDLPLARLLRLSLFQVSVGMAIVLIIGTLNRVMIVELGVPVWLVATMVALPLLFAPLRAVIGHKSDNHRSVLGWRRVPYLWMGTLVQFGGLAIMPFALIILSGDTTGPLWIGDAAAALAFLLTGMGLHTVQTVGLALATDIAPKDSHPRVVTMLCSMMLLGMVVSAVVFGALLANFSQMRLIQVIQGSAVCTVLLNGIALWKQEARDPSRTRGGVVRPAFRDAWRVLTGPAGARRRMVATALGTAAFSMQDILLEPYGGQVLKLPVGTTTSLTALLALGGITGFVVAGRGLARGWDPYRIAAFGALAGLLAFAAVIFADPLSSAILFGVGTMLIGFGAAHFETGMLTATMREAPTGQTGIALGAWGAVQSVAAGTAIAAGGLLRDVVSGFAEAGSLGPGLASPSVGYSFVYHVEIYMLFTTLVALGPLVRTVIVRRGLHQPASASPSPLTSLS